MTFKIWNLILSEPFFIYLLPLEYNDIWSMFEAGGKWPIPPFPPKRVSNLSSFSVNRYSKVLIVEQLRGDWALPR